MLCRPGTLNGAKLLSTKMVKSLKAVAYCHSYLNYGQTDRNVESGIKEKRESGWLGTKL